MSSSLQIALVAVAAGVSCALVGVFLVLRRMAMMADAISHAILPGLVAGYVLARGPNIFVGFLGATAAGLLTVALVEALTKSKRVKQDAAIGLVFPALFALGVLVVSKYFANVHIDTDAVLYGEIAFAPFDTLIVGGRDLGPQSLWVLSGLAIVNAGFLTLLYKELKLSTFDAGLASALGFLPGVLHYLLMSLVAVTTVGAFSAVGAILSVALIIVPPVTASLLTKRLPLLLGLSVAIGAGSSLIGYLLAVYWNVSISGMIATSLGGVFLITLLISPSQGLVAQTLKRRMQKTQFATEMLVVHLSVHENTPEEAQESTLLHLEQELGWPIDRAAWIVAKAQQGGLVLYEDGVLTLTPTGKALALAVGFR
ncbi:MAG: metal ABC transporter permease [Fimbriimonadaceae bacterium]|nr:metal ABC transporter permease [Fimbriimonadaceae bacterium]